MRPLSTYRLHQRLSFRIARLARILHARLEAELAPHGLTRLMWLILYGVGVDGVETPSGLASYLGVARPSISRLLHRMQTDGLIQRDASPEGDGRNVQLSLTEAGRQLLGELLPRIDAHNEHFCMKLDPVALSALMDTLDRLAAGEAEPSLTT